MDVHDHVCVLVAAESRVFDSLSLLCKASLLDEASERKTQVWEKHMTQHKLYTSSVRAVETILHKVKLLRTSQACQDHYDACLCINSLACLSLSMCVHVSVLLLPLLGRCDSLVCVFVSRLKFV